MYVYVVGRVTPVTLSPLQSCDIIVTQGQFCDFVSWLCKQRRMANWRQLLVSVLYQSDLIQSCMYLNEWYQKFPNE